ncbi:DUF3822 family protein [Alistipes sp.]|uniref:DUF3822 family protein n=1 Tax=Alistipes sp. TaxID=1872444 RepID=UPI003A849C4C
MKQVTGNSTSPSQFRVSIQQSLDGHSFSRPELAQCPPSTGTVEVELIVPHTALIPEPLYSNERKEELLAANGTPATDEERVVACMPKNGCVAVAAVNAKILQQLVNKFSAIIFTTPLEHVPQNTRKSVWTGKRGELLYTKVYDDGKLQFAEVIPATSEAEVRYFVERLGKLFPLREYELRLTGDDTKQLRKWIGNEFGKTVCE